MTNVSVEYRVDRSSQKERIRKAVNAVKAGASDYLTYPLDAEELKLVSENLNKTRIMQSELNYLRNQFWQVDSLELLRTNSEIMGKVLQQIRTGYTFPNFR